MSKEDINLEINHLRDLVEKEKFHYNHVSNMEIQGLALLVALFIPFLANPQPLISHLMILISFFSFFIILQLVSNKKLDNFRNKIDKYHSKINDLHLKLRSNK